MGCRYGGDADNPTERKADLYHIHADRAAYEAAATLIDDFGDYAADEAAARAERSRTLGNIVHFCRWRQVERTIALLAGDRATGSIH